VVLHSNEASAYTKCAGDIYEFTCMVQKGKRHLNRVPQPMCFAFTHVLCFSVFFCVFLCVCVCVRDHSVVDAGNATLMSREHDALRFGWCRQHAVFSFRACTRVRDVIDGPVRLNVDVPNKETAISWPAYA
jgi:hypothetical protein